MILIGGGGHCRSCIDVIEMDSRFAIRGIADEEEALDPTLTDYALRGWAAPVRVLQDLSDKAMRAAIHRVCMEGLRGRAGSQAGRRVL